MMRVTGTAFPARTTVQLAWDGTTEGKPAAKVGPNGTFKVRMLVDGSPPGEHTVSALMSSSSTTGRKAPTATTLQVVASFVVTVLASTATPTPTVSGTVSPETTPTEAPTASPTARPTRDPTAVPTAVPTPLPTPVPPPQATPVPPRPTTPPATGGGLAMPAGAIWSDGFGGSTLNSANWRRETVFDGQTDTFAKWGQFSSDSRLYNVGNGLLTLRALRVSGQRAPYISPMISSRDLFSHGYGIYRASMRYDRGHALWPALWLLDGAGVSSELDIFEGYPEPANPRNYTFYAHYDGQQWGHTLSTAADFDSAFHVYELEWRPNVLISRLDGVEKARIDISFPDTHKLVLHPEPGGWGLVRRHGTRMPQRQTTPLCRWTGSESGLFS